MKPRKFHLHLGGGIAVIGLILPNHRHGQGGGGDFACGGQGVGDTGLAKCAVVKRIVACLFPCQPNILDGDGFALADPGAVKDRLIA